VHFVPIQSYGISGSHYSIADQTNIDDYFFGGKEKAEKEGFSTREHRIQYLKEKMHTIREQYGLLGIIDIVLNHTANSSEWIVEHPEATYNTDNCPHLTSAYLFDKELANFSRDFSEKRVNECPSAPFINNENDLTRVVEVIKTKVIPKLKLVEFFQANIEQNLQ
jgi:glycogen debranching enzyme